jgi:hypothetical protein
LSRIITGLLIAFLLIASTACAGETPPTYSSATPEPERPDDIVSTPGGPQYRANVHQAGIENPWPPVETEEVSLDEDVTCVYRAYIESEAGETRNNIVHVRTPGRDITDANLPISGAPPGIEVKQGMEWNGPRSIAQVLVMEISSDVPLGQYVLGIGIEINGRNYGTVPCTIEVIDHATLNNHGITDISIQPEPGQILVYDEQKSAGVILKSVAIKSDICDKDYFDLPRNAPVRKGQPCLLVTGQVEGQLDQDKYMTLSAQGYDADEEQVTYALDHGPIWGVISVHIPARGANEFALHLKTAPDLKRVELMPSSELYDIPPP